MGDAKAWLDLFLTARASGSRRDALRRFIRATWELAQTVTHGDIERVEAFAAAQATVLVVRTVQALAPEDRRRPPGESGPGRRCGLANGPWHVVGGDPGAVLG